MAAIDIIYKIFRSPSSVIPMVQSSTCFIIIDDVFVIVFTLAQPHKLGCLTTNLQSYRGEAEDKLRQLIMAKKKV
jgi:hypothetical protein